MGTIADKTAALASTKADIKSALQEQGQQVNDVFSTYGDAIRAIAPGVSSFNGRTGAVSPGADDYSASMIKFTDGQTFQQKYDAGQLTGPAGANGSNGQDGSPGADGEDGGYYKPAVDGSGNLTWTASKSGMPAVSGANIKGATGPAGTNGTDGKDATINGVNALTIEAGDNINLSQSGSTLTINAEGGGGIPVVTTSGTGAEYTATVPGVTELYNGLTLIIVPHVANELAAKFNLNNLGSASVIRLTVEGENGGVLTKNIFIANNPYLLTYSSAFSSWVVAGIPSVATDDIAISMNSSTYASKVRGISFATSTPSSIYNGCIVGVYST